MLGNLTPAELKLGCNVLPAFTFALCLLSLVPLHVDWIRHWIRFQRLSPVDSTVSTADETG